jgi:hypothetical protein
MTILLSQPCISSVEKWERYLGTVVAGLVGVALGHASFATLVEHEVEVLAPAIGVAAGHDDGGCLLDLALVVGGGAQAFLLVFRLDDDEAPGLHVVAAGRAEAGLEDLAQVLRAGWVRHRSWAWRAARGSPDSVVFPASPSSPSSLSLVLNAPFDRNLAVNSNRTLSDSQDSTPTPSRASGERLGRRRASRQRAVRGGFNAQPAARPGGKQNLRAWAASYILGER